MLRGPARNRKTHGLTAEGLVANQWRMRPNSDAREYLLVEEVAEHGRTSVATVRKWLSTGKLKSSRPGRRRLVRRADLEAFLMSSPTKEPSRG